MGWEVTNLSKQWTGREYTVYKQIATLGQPPAIIFDNYIKCFFRVDTGLCWGKSSFSPHGRWHIFRVDRNPQCSGSFACLASHPSLANRTGTTVEVVVARCHNCSSKLCWKCGQCGLRSVQQKVAAQELQMNCNFGTATSYYLLNGFSRGIRLCVGGSLAFLIDDLTFYGRWHIFRVDRNPQCSGSFACLGSHPSLGNRTGTNVEVVVARCRNCSSKLCWKCGQSGLRSLQQKAAVQHLQYCCRCIYISSSTMNRVGQRRKLSSTQDAS